MRRFLCLLLGHRDTARAHRMPDGHHELQSCCRRCWRIRWDRIQSAPFAATRN